MYVEASFKSLLGSGPTRFFSALGHCSAQHLKIFETFFQVLSQMLPNRHQSVSQRWLSLIRAKFNTGRWQDSAIDLISGSEFALIGAEMPWSFSQFLRGFPDLLHFTLSLRRLQLSEGLNWEAGAILSRSTGFDEIPVYFWLTNGRRWIQEHPEY